MTVFLLEDERPIRDDMKRCILSAESNIHIIECKKIFEAIEFFNDTVDIAIIDLNMDPEGLTESQCRESESGLYTGWVWLKHYVFNSEHYRPNQRFLILSDYTNNIIKLSSKMTIQDKEHFNRLRMLPKGKQSGDYTNIIEEIKNYLTHEGGR